MRRLDDLASYIQLIRLLEEPALIVQARRAHAASSREELRAIRAEFARRRRRAREAAPVEQRPAA